MFGILGSLVLATLIICSIILAVYFDVGSYSTDNFFMLLMSIPIFIPIVIIILCILLSIGVVILNRQGKYIEKIHCETRDEITNILNEENQNNYFQTGIEWKLKYDVIPGRLYKNLAVIPSLELLDIWQVVYFQQPIYYQTIPQQQQYVEVTIPQQEYFEQTPLLNKEPQY